MENTENNVISLEEFRKTHPVASGKLYKFPKRKKFIISSVLGQTQPPARNSKLEEALKKYGSFSGAAIKEFFGKKEPVTERE